MKKLNAESIKFNARGIIGLLLIILGAVVGLYVGAWCMVIQPIMYACACFDAGALTGVIIGMTVLKCVFAPVVGWLIFYIFTLIGVLVIGE